VWIARQGCGAAHILDQHRVVALLTLSILAFAAETRRWRQGENDDEFDLDHRLACRADLDALRDLMDAAISELQKPFLDENQIASSRAIMGLDTQLIDDGTYFIVEVDGNLAGCGGWSRRATLYGGDQSPTVMPS